MPPSLPSASRIDLALACVGSCVLPACRESSAAADDGTTIHRFLERARVDRAAALAEIADEDVRERCEAIDLSIIPAGAESEVAMAWSPVTGRAERLDVAGHRAYPRDGRYCGTADLVGQVGGNVWIADWKTGHAPDAATSWQLRTLALMAARIAGTPGAVVSMIQIDQGGGCHVDQHGLDFADIDETETALRRLAERIDAAQGTVPTLSPGVHCRYCPALRQCPAQVALVRAMATDLDVSAQVEALTDAQCGEAWEKLTMHKRRLEVIEDALRTRAASLADGIPLPSGQVLREVRWTQTVQSPEAKAKIAALKFQLTEAGEITKQKTTQVRVVGRKAK